MANTFRDDVEFEGTVTFSGSAVLPAGSVTNSSFSSSSTNRLASEKVVHRVDLEYSQVNGTSVVSETKLLRLCRASGTVLGVKVRPTTAPTGGDKQFTVDIQKASDASGSWTSLLNAVVTVNSSSADNTLQTATLAATPTTAANQAIRVVITASGSTGTQGQGVLVQVWYEESPV